MITLFFSSSSLIYILLAVHSDGSSDLAYWHVCTPLPHCHSSRQTLVSVSLQVSVWNVAECKTNTLEHGAAHCATRRDGHYFSGLPKNIIIKAMEEIWGSQAWCGNNGLGAPVECYCPIPLFFLSQIWLFPRDMIEIIIPRHREMRFGESAPCLMGNVNSKVWGEICDGLSGFCDNGIRSPLQPFFFFFPVYSSVLVVTLNASPLPDSLHLYSVILRSIFEIDRPVESAAHVHKTNLI